ncbi:MAG: DNA gyrase inhibitor YacG [Hyphomicrobiaceae bacterium]|nr:DNA gyrase inhibitor YacG [Hyphomicrobiaceae bacterium]
MTDRSARRGATCPICQAQTAPDFRPFCSRRCADIDLSRWLGGVYAVPGGADADEDGDAVPAASATRSGDDER